MLAKQCKIPTYYESALEIGCGTGYLTRHFLQACDIGHLYLNDLYDDVKKMATGDCVTHYLIGDIQKIALPYQSLDLVFSSSAIQWIYPLNDLFNHLYKSIKEGGYLIFSSYLSDNLWQIKKLTSHGLKYYSDEELKQLLCLSGFELLSYEQKYYELLFDDSYQILKHLKYTGVTANRDGFVWNKQALKKFDENYQSLAITKNNWLYYPLTYHGVLVIAQRKSL